MSGIIAAYGKRANHNVFSSLYSGIYALQHRGQDSMGICCFEHENLAQIKGPGLISDNITLDNITRLEGNIGLAHVKYPFENQRENILPMPWVYTLNDGTRALLAMDGRFTSPVNYEELVEVLNGGIEGIEDFLSGAEGAFSLLFCTPEKMLGIRDRHGIKPLVAGEREGESLLSSETCAIESIRGKVSHFLKPGEIFYVDKKGQRSYYVDAFEESPCIFEQVYTARPDSYISNQLVYEARSKAGQILYREAPVDADIVVGSPDSGIISAMGFSKASGIPYESAIVRNRYIGRTFIYPTDEMRQMGIEIKLSPIKELMRGKDVVLVDDSIVRGNTMKRVIEILKDSGARKIHIRIASPPVIETEDLTFDIPDKNRLIANGKTVDQIREIIGADSLAYLSLAGLREACGNKKYYERCFGGYDPIH